MKKKIKININGKPKFVSENFKLIDLIKMLKIPVKKVAIELNYEILDKKKINKKYLKSNDKIEIVHFIGGG
ncbi:sulfur carrier protein ThiS [Candidatus Pelagibacter sp.]|nr:sulfur carrier protein ThiS [Candidatus Pelagibacter sp.]